MSNEITVRPTTEIVKDDSPGQITSFLMSRIGQLSKCCPNGISAEVMIQVASLIVRTTPKLQECHPDTIFTSIMDAGSLGLSLHKVQGECYLIPRWNKNTKRVECSAQPGYRGLTKLVRGNGKVEYIVAHVVYEKDLFKVALAPEPVITHEPFIGSDRGQMIAVYSMVRFLTGSTIYDYMLKDDVEKIRKSSEAPDGVFWKNNYNEMAKKTVLKRHAKSLDQTPELARAIELDNIDFQDDEPVVKQLADNGTSHGRGKYCTEAEAKVCIDAIDKIRNKYNGLWNDRWTDKRTGEIPECIKELCPRIYQADNHCAKWAVQTGLLVPESMSETGLKPAQLGRLTGVLYHRSQQDRIALRDELVRYMGELERIALQALQNSNPELFEPEVVEEAATEEEWEEGRE